MKNREGLVSSKNLAISRAIEFALLAVLACSSLASAQYWRPAPPFPGQGAGTALLTPYGGVMVQELTGQASQGGFATGAWYLLMPDIDGHYFNGSWTQIAGLEAGYAPLYFASAILPDGRVVVAGGEYNQVSQDDTRLAEIYSGGDWSPLSAPENWRTIGDAPSVVLANGELMLGDCCSSKEAILNPTNLTWSATGSGKAENNSEEGWTLLPNNKVLTVDTELTSSAELYNPSTGSWSHTTKMPINLTNNCHQNIVPEIGPAVLRPDGTVFATGANGNTAIYDYKTDEWKTGPFIPNNSAGQGRDGIADGPAALLVNGHVLIMSSNINPCFITPSDFYEFDGKKIKPVPGPPNASNEISFDGRMVELPTGTILFTDGTQDVEIYTPSGGPESSWAPTIKAGSYPTTVNLGQIYTISGTQFNGLSQGAAYGDDAQSATNFPLLRIKNKATNHVFYGVSFAFSTMGVATGSEEVSTDFVLFPPAETGPSILEVVANGISSIAVDITVAE